MVQFYCNAQSILCGGTLGSVQWYNSKQGWHSATPMPIVATMCCVRWFNSFTAELGLGTKVFHVHKEENLFGDNCNNWFKSHKTTIQYTTLLCMLLESPKNCWV